MRIEDATLAVVDALNAESIPYLLSGSLASNYYGIPRSTQDADFVVQLGERPITCLGPHLGPEFAIERQTAFETITGTTKHVIDVGRTNFQIELFRLSDDPHDQMRFSRRRSVKLLDRDVHLPTAEDVIVTKLRWFRRKDLDDVQNVIAVQGGSLDWQYISEWCERHGTRRQLDEIRQSATLTDED